MKSEVHIPFCLFDNHCFAYSPLRSQDIPNPGKMSRHLDKKYILRCDIRNCLFHTSTSAMNRLYSSRVTARLLTSSSHSISSGCQVKRSRCRSASFPEVSATPRIDFRLFVPLSIPTYFKLT